MKTAMGLTLVELLVVIAILAILVSFSSSWIKGSLKKHRLRQDLDKIYAALNEARLLAFTKKRTCGVWFGSDNFSSIEVRCDNSTPPDGDIDDNSTDIVYKRLNLHNLFQKSTSTESVNYIREGLTSNILTICPKESDYLPNKSCIKVNRVSIRFGTWDGGVCNSDHCN